RRRGDDNDHDHAGSRPRAPGGCAADPRRLHLLSGERRPPPHPSRADPGASGREAHSVRPGDRVRADRRFVLDPGRRPQAGSGMTKLPTSAKRSMLGAALLIVIIVGWFVAIAPKRSEASKLQKQI